MLGCMVSGFRVWASGFGGSGNNDKRVFARQGIYLARRL